jgi:DNA-binding NarL/FixJ family response regulator
MSEVIKILIVEDHKLITQAWKMILESQENFKVIAEADNAKDAYELCIGYRPDIVLMDINLKESNGIDATATITNSLPKTKIIGLSLHSDISIVKRLISVGAKGYLSKNCDRSEMIEAIHKVFAGEIYIAAEIKDRYFSSMMQVQSENAEAKKELTTKEIEIIKLISTGMTSKEIGDKLFISSRTVDTHRHNILKKLDIPNAAQLSRWAIEKGYV